MSLQVRLNFPGIERQQILANLLEYHSTGFLTEIRFDHAEKIWLDGESQPIVELMEPAFFQILGNALCEFLAVLLAG